MYPIQSGVYLLYTKWCTHGFFFLIEKDASFCSCCLGVQFGCGRSMVVWLLIVEDPMIKFVAVGVLNNGIN